MERSHSGRVRRLGKAVDCKRSRGFESLPLRQYKTSRISRFVLFTDSIPSDYDGVMGVMISFLDKYSLEQFEIIKFRHGNDDKDLRLKDGKCPYFRILIKHKKKPIKN